MPDWAHQFDFTSRLLYPLLSQSARCHRHAVHAALTSITSLPPILSCTVPAFSLFFHPLASAAPFFVIGSFSISFSFSISRALTAGAAGPMPAVSMGAHTPAQLEMCVSSPPCQLNPTATCSVASPMASQQPMFSRNTIQVPDQMKRQISIRRIFEIIGAFQVSNISGACQCHFSCVVARSRPSCIVKLSANSRPFFNFPAPRHHNSDFYSIHALSFINGSTWRPCRFFSIIFGQPCRNAPLLVKSRSGPRSRVHDAAVFSSSHHRPPTSSPLLRLEKSLDAPVRFCHSFDLF